MTDTKVLAAKEITVGPISPGKQFLPAFGPSESVTTGVVVAALCQQAETPAASSSSTAQPAAAGSNDTIAAIFAPVLSTINTILERIRTMSATNQTEAQQLEGLVAGLQSDIAAANQRVTTHETANVNAVAALNAELARLTQTPGDTSVTEDVITNVISGLTQARAQAAAILPDSTAAAAGADTTGGGAAGSTVTGDAGTDTTGGAGAGSTVTGGTGTATTGGGASGSTVTGGTGTDTTSGATS